MNAPNPDPQDRRAASHDIRAFRPSRLLNRLALAALCLGISAMVVALTVTHVTAAGTPAAVITGLNQPVYIAADPTGNLYIADLCGNTSGIPGDCKVYKETLSAGLYKQSPVATLTASTAPGGLAVDANDNLYVATFARQVYKETPSGQSYTASPVGCAFNAPGGIAIDAQGFLYVSDGATGNLTKESQTAPCVTPNIIATGLNHPASVAIDKCGIVYVAQTGVQNEVFKEIPSGSGYTQMPVNQISSPMGVAVDSSQNVFVPTSGGFVYQESPFGAGYSQTVIQSGLNNPTGVAVDGAGNIYVVENGGNTVWKLPPASGAAATCPASPTGLTATPAPTNN